MTNCHPKSPELKFLGTNPGNLHFIRSPATPIFMNAWESLPKI